MVGQAGFFSLGELTSLGERKTYFIPLKNWPCVTSCSWCSGWINTYFSWKLTMCHILATAERVRKCIQGVMFFVCVVELLLFFDCFCSFFLLLFLFCFLFVFVFVSVFFFCFFFLVFFCSFRDDEFLTAANVLTTEQLYSPLMIDGWTKFNGMSTCLRWFSHFMLRGLGIAFRFTFLCCGFLRLIDGF